MNSSNDSLLAAIIKNIAHCLDSFAVQPASSQTLINYVPTYVSQGSLTCALMQRRRHASDSRGSEMRVRLCVHVCVRACVRTGECV